MLVLLIRGGRISKNDGAAYAGMSYAQMLASTEEPLPTLPDTLCSMKDVMDRIQIMAYQEAYAAAGQEVLRNLTASGALSPEAIPDKQEH